MVKKKSLDWEQVVSSGFGDRHNLCAWSMTQYKNHLYVGTLNFTNGCQIYRSPNGDKGTWEQVNSNGFTDDTKSEGARTMLVYKNLLWVLTLCRRHGTQIWVTNGEKDDTNQITWKKANTNGFGLGEKIHGSRAMIIYQDKMYIGTQCKQGIPRIYRYDGPREYEKINPEQWTLINKEWQQNFRTILNLSLVGFLETFQTPTGKEYLYAGAYSEVVPLLGQLKRKFTTQNLLQIMKFFTILRSRIFRYDGTHWEEIGKPGFGKTNMMTMSSQRFHDTLYVGTTNLCGGELWQTTNGTDWVRIMKHGFGYPWNISVWRLHTFENRLIVGTQNHFLGCQIWASTTTTPHSNKDFIQIARRGMQKKLQLNPLHLKQDGIRTFETYHDQLYAGTASDMNIIRSNSIGPGCEIWRITQVS
ncbi:MAG: hypothetical protein V1726_00970 [Methanobacteriota archaeon]